MSGAEEGMTPPDRWWARELHRWGWHVGALAQSLHQQAPHATARDQQTLMVPNRQALVVEPRHGAVKKETAAREM